MPNLRRGRVRSAGAAWWGDWRRAVVRATVSILLSIPISGVAFAEPIHVYAAGSLDAAFTQLIAAFGAKPGDIAAPVFGPSGVLRERIEQGAPVDILASADMTQPRRLGQTHPGRPVIVFTRNRLCILAAKRLRLTQDNVLERMLDPTVRLATSTPGSDPSGDYAWQVFHRAEALHPGAEAALQAKALKLVGGRDTPPLVAGHGSVAGVFLANKADAMVGYCSGSASVMRDVPDLDSVPLPPSLEVASNYGMIVLTERPEAMALALFVMSEAGQAILQHNGFAAVAVAEPS